MRPYSLSACDERVVPVFFRLDCFDFFDIFLITSLSFLFEIAMTRFLSPCAFSSSLESLEHRNELVLASMAGQQFVEVHAPFLFSAHNVISLAGFCQPVRSCIIVLSTSPVHNGFCLLSTSLNRPIRTRG